MDNKEAKPYQIVVTNYNKGLKLDYQVLVHAEKRDFVNEYGAHYSQIIRVYRHKNYNNVENRRLVIVQISSRDETGNEVMEDHLWFPDKESLVDFTFANFSFADVQFKNESSVDIKPSEALDKSRL